MPWQVNAHRVRGRPGEGAIDDKLPVAGEMFEQRYQLLDVLGRGGFAIVYRALDTVLSREVAIKVLAPLQGPEAKNVRQRFLREAAVFASLEDPHTITMFDFGESTDGRLFMVFEYLQSVELRDVIKSGKGRHPRVATRILIQLASALREAHQKGVYHRDIKPANVLVYEYDGDPFRVKLIDFGIAKDVNPDVVSLTRTGRIVGTPRYMAPEQLFGQPIGPESDIYSLGLLGFEILSGRPAVDATKNKEVLKRQVSDEPFIVSPDVAPSGLRRVVERMMAKDRRERYQSAATLLDDLRAVMPEVRRWAGPVEDGIETIVDDEDGVDTLVADAELDTVDDSRDPQPLATASMSGESPRPAWGLVPLVALGVILLGLALYLVTRPPDEAPAPTTPTRSNVGALLGTPSNDQPTQAPTPDVGAADVQSDPTVPPGCGLAREPGQSEHRYDASEWGWILHVPEGYDPDVRHPVILMFHRSWTDGRGLLQDTGLAEIADANQAILVAFDSESTLPWRGENDIALVVRTLQDVGAHVCVDYSRLYALGDGAGGGFAERIACSFPISAVVTTAHGTWVGDRPCTPVAPTPRLRIYGAIDRHVPADGGVSCVPLTGPYIPAADIRASWKEIYRCEDRDSKWRTVPGGTCLTSVCEVARVIDCETTGGHYWPGAEPLGIDLNGCETEDPKPYFPYREITWAFFSEEGRVLSEADLAAQRALMDW